MNVSFTPHASRTALASWHSEQEGFVACAGRRFPWAEACHSSTNGRCTPEWHWPQPRVRSVPTASGASGLFPGTSGFVTWASPGPWQDSHCTSWYRGSFVATQPTFVSVTRLPREDTEWHDSQTSRDEPLATRVCQAPAWAVCSHAFCLPMWQFPQTVMPLSASE